MPATMSIRGLAYVEDTIFNEMVLPAGMTSDDKAIITDMIQKLLRIVYPGYSRDKSYRI